MYSLAFLGFCSLVLSLLLTPLFRNLCLRLGLVDSPDQLRKVHKRPIPRIGGVPILLSCIGAFSLLLLSPLSGANMVQHGLPLVWKLFPAVVLVFAVGLSDDLIGLAPWQKLAAEIVAALLVCFAGVSINFRGYEGGWWSIPLTVFWLIGCTNAFNLIDGVDGLAAGVGLLATLTTLIAALLQGNFPLAAATVPLAGALLGFLRFNFNPASIFLGDSGSLSIGFLLGCYGLIWSAKSATLLGMTAPVMAVSIPLLDTVIAIARRFLRHQPIFGADRGHIHHRLLDRGLTPRRVALLLYGFCGLGAAFSLLLSLAHNQYAGPIVVLFCGAAWLGIQHLGYVEFSLARRLFTPNAFRRVLNAQLRLRALEDCLKAAQTVDDCWHAIRSASADFGVNHLSMRLDHTVYQERLGTAEFNRCWTLEVPLSATEFVRLGHPMSAPIPPLVVGPLAEILRRTLEPKLPAFQNPGDRQNHVAS